MEAEAVAAGRQLYGVHMDITWLGDRAEQTRAVRRARELGAQVSRNTLLWSRIERVRGRRDWSSVDHVVDELVRADIAPLMVLMGSPPWANGTEDSLDRERHLRVPRSRADFERWVREYAEIAGSAARRYAGRVGHWELWNEPNGHFFWKPRPDPRRYAAWYRAVERALREAQPGARISIGGVSNLTAKHPGDYSGAEFLREVLAQDVRADAVSIHPYPGQHQGPDVTLPFENNFDDIGRICALLRELGRGKLEIWVTEWGWRVADVGEQRQAEYVRRSLEALADRHPYVTLAVYFMDTDRFGFTHGLRDSAARLRPSGQAFQEFVRQSAGRAAKRRGGDRCTAAGDAARESR
jgi:hypothetical protein